MIPFKSVYRMRRDVEVASWSIVMGLTPLPSFDGLWMVRASLTHPEISIRGKVFEGSDGNLVLTGVDGRYVMEFLTIAAWENMRADVTNFEYIRKVLDNDVALQSWYWIEFAHDGDGNELRQDVVVSNLQRRLRSSLS